MINYFLLLNYELQILTYCKTMVILKKLNLLILKNFLQILRILK